MLSISTTPSRGWVDVGIPVHTVADSSPYVETHSASPLVASGLVPCCKKMRDFISLTPHL